MKFAVHCTHRSTHSSDQVLTMMIGDTSDW